MVSNRTYAVLARRDSGVAPEENTISNSVAYNMNDSS